MPSSVMEVWKRGEAGNLSASLSQVTGSGDAAMAIPGSAGILSRVASIDMAQLQTGHSLVVDDLNSHLLLRCQCFKGLSIFQAILFCKLQRFQGITEISCSFLSLFHGLQASQHSLFFCFCNIQFRQHMTFSLGGMLLFTALPSGSTVCAERVSSSQDSMSERSAISERSASLSSTTMASKGESSSTSASVRASS
ncbi:hypothetical protein E2C01_007737 [Portunus trituberculatus]|uniref:Uncharacterized protein n=1 Tax=Portunus trituberculatus TaxID=210409 RepID=A0A5B7D0H4_PORTR|nr:hypothetical protein [Portunus trituberculatus]